jgi:hypothetical protein
MAQQRDQVLLEKNKDGSGKVSVKNMQAKPINQAQGPRMGNAGSPGKRATFQKEKAASGNEKSALATMVMDALAGRGAGMQGKIDPTVEGLSSNTGPKHNPTAGGTKYKTTGRK